MKLLIDADGCLSAEGVAITPICKGWSQNKKYRIETAQGERFLLRVAEKAQRRQMKADFAGLNPVAKLGEAAQQPVAFGRSGKWVYSVLTWVDGEDLTSVLPTLAQDEQYAVGLQAGALLKQIHAVVPVKRPKDYVAMFRQNISKSIERYVPIGMSPEDSRIIIDYLIANKRALGSRPRTFLHGDYNTGNLILMPDGTLGAIDFLAYFGDPWQELCAISVGEEATPHYQTGLVNSYFDGKPPAEFFEAMAYQSTFDALTRVSPDDSPEVFEIGCKHIKNIFRWFDRFQNTIPTWYLQDWSTT
ncbi:MAG: phosphotransferase [Firmicutes bacterium]|nr:phosphotransferase [Bacillota bacterium]